MELRSAMGAGGSASLGDLLGSLGIGPRRGLGDMAAAAGTRRISGRYDSALTTDDNRAHWAMADALAVDAANSPMIRYILRNRSRYEVANNGYARGVGLINECSMPLYVVERMASRTLFGRLVHSPLRWTTRGPLLGISYENPSVSNIFHDIIRPTAECRARDMSFLEKGLAS